MLIRTLKLEMKVVIAAMLIMVMVSSSAFTASINDEADKKYQKAYNLVLDEQWSEAEKILNEIIRKYPDSKYVDDAKFWKCHILEKRDNALEECFKCYQDLTKKYPDSKWSDDARNNMVRLAQKLSKQGKKEYEAIANNMMDDEKEEIMLAALHSLQSRGDDRAFAVIEDLLETTKSPKIRKKIIYVLGTFETEKANKKLVDLAKNDEDVQVRKEAIFWLGQNSESPEVAKLLTEMILKDPSSEIQKRAVFAISQMDSEISIDQLVEIAKKHKSVDVRAEAIFWLGQSDTSPKVFKILKDFIFEDPDQKIQKKAVFALSQFANEMSEKVLIEVARKHKNMDIRGEAIFWLGQNSQSDKVYEALKEFTMNDAELKIQKKAIFALAQFETDKSLESLIDIAKNHKNIEARKEAIFWMGQRSASAKVFEALKNFALNDPDETVQKRAIFSLAQYSGKESRTFLMNIARKHKNTIIRKEAIFWLGQNADSKEAMDLLLEIAWKDAELDVQKRAVFGIAQGESEFAIPALIKLAKEHPAIKVRKEAIFWLGQSDDERAAGAIEEILYKK